MSVHEIERWATKQVCFGPFRLLPNQRLLLLNDNPVRLSRPALDILMALVERPDELVTRDELMSKVWRGMLVEPAKVTAHIAAVRRALGDGTESCRYLVTVPGRGYLFVAPVKVQESLSHRLDEPQGITLRLAKGEELFAEGEAAEYFYKVTAGTVPTYKLLSDGRRQIDAFHLAGDIFGIEANSERRFSAEAVSSVTVSTWRRSRLDQLTRERRAGDGVDDRWPPHGLRGIGCAPCQAMRHPTGRNVMPEPFALTALESEAPFRAGGGSTKLNRNSTASSSGLR